jgi:hypothetical protein
MMPHDQMPVERRKHSTCLNEIPTMMIIVAEDAVEEDRHAAETPRQPNTWCNNGL